MRFRDYLVIELLLFIGETIVFLIILGWLYMMTSLPFWLNWTVTLLLCFLFIVRLSDLLDFYDKKISEYELEVGMR